MADIQLKNIYKKYIGADDYTVTDFNLDIEDHEFIVFVGPSGCGKSTTLRMIAGLEEISEGELYIDGQLVNSMQPKDRDIAMVFQNYALYPHMTVEENMSFGLKLRKVPASQIKERVAEAARMTGLEEYLQRKPSQLSGGQRQRVALGRAIVRNAKVFLMDEPLSNLDAKLRVKMRAEITKLHENLNATTIYVTHDQTEAMTLATRIVILKDGFIQQVGSPKEVYDKPDNVFVGGFIGSPAMNFMEVTYQDGRISDGRGIDFPVAPPMQHLLDDRGYNGKRVIFGIRPEDIKAEQITIETIPNSTLNTAVTMSELTGSEALLFLESNGSEFSAKVNARDYKVRGDQIEVAFDMNKAHFFDIETENAIRQDK